MALESQETVKAVHQNVGKCVGRRSLCTIGDDDKT